MNEKRPPLDESLDSDELLKQDRVGYDPTTETYYAQYDTDKPAELASRIVRSVAAVTGQTPRNFEPLYTVVDPEAMKRLFDKARKNPMEHKGVQVTFEFESCKITIGWDGEIRIERLDEMSTDR